MAKIFFRVWNPTEYNVSNKVYDFCSIDDISIAEGYEQEDIDNVSKLEVSELLKCDGDDHVIIRVK